ncbi:hypothetical protein HN011_002422 [Eciton burchellii]|nr:hypothetical protein HN011_002422 [Eciton burchellii]
MRFCYRDTVLREVYSFSKDLDKDLRAHLYIYISARGIIYKRPIADRSRSESEQVTCRFIKTARRSEAVDQDVQDNGQSCAIHMRPASPSQHSLGVQPARQCLRKGQRLLHPVRVQSLGRPLHRRTMGKSIGEIALGNGTLVSNS